MLLETLVDCCLPIRLNSTWMYMVFNGRIDYQNESTWCELFCGCGMLWKEYPDIPTIGPVKHPFLYGTYCCGFLMTLPHSKKHSKRKSLINGGLNRKITFKTCNNDVPLPVNTVNCSKHSQVSSSGNTLCDIFQWPI